MKIFYQHWTKIKFLLFNLVRILFFVLLSDRYLLKNDKILQQDVIKPIIFLKTEQMVQNSGRASLKTLSFQTKQSLSKRMWRNERKTKFGLPAVLQINREVKSYQCVCRFPSCCCGNKISWRKMNEMSALPERKRRRYKQEVGRKHGSRRAEVCLTAWQMTAIKKRCWGKKLITDYESIEVLIRSSRRKMEGETPKAEQEASKFKPCFFVCLFFFGFFFFG